MRGRFLPTGDDHRVTSLELLFDLVFVYAITAVSDSISHRLDLVGLTQGMVVMALVWFAWSAYAWLGNQARADEGPLRVSMFLAMAGFYVVALTINEAFDDRPGGLRGPVVFVVAYAVIRLAHLTVYWFAAGDDRGLRRTIERTLLTASVVLALLLVGAYVDPGPRLAIWSAAVLIDYVTVFLGATTGWRVAAPGHFAERYGLVVIIAIGESVVSVGLAVNRAAIDWPLLGGALLGITLAITLWRTYFNAIAVSAEHRLREVSGDARTVMARDTFTYLHLPLVAGIVAMAVGLRVMLDDVALAERGHGHGVPAFAVMTLYGGSAAYLASLSVLRWRLRGRPSLPRLVTAAWLVAVGSLLAAVGVAPLTDVAVVTATFLALVTYDAWRYGQQTRDLRLGLSS
ncbi:MAG TPA: low temperature requirement protein A [Nocardioides sp.]|nr:low temperature requirement protein A [Nocardioides sp.]